MISIDQVCLQKVTQLSWQNKDFCKCLKLQLPPHFKEAANSNIFFWTCPRHFFHNPFCCFTSIFCQFAAKTFQTFRFLVKVFFLWIKNSTFFPTFYLPNIYFKRFFRDCPIFQLTGCTFWWASPSLLSVHFEKTVDNYIFLIIFMNKLYLTFDNIKFY